MKMAVVDKLKEQYVKMDWSNLDWVNDVDISNATVDAVPISVIEGIKAEIEERKLKSGGEPNRELAFNVCLKIIDHHIKEYTE